MLCLKIKQIYITKIDKVIKRKFKRRKTQGNFSKLNIFHIMILLTIFIVIKEGIISKIAIIEMRLMF